LAAIQEFTELGVGFNIAMRDMEIRGAGNLLGREQHGSMCAVGFELYCRMLEEAVETLRGTMLGEEQAPEVEIQWKVSAHIPPQYVPVEAQRVMLYKRLVEARTLEELDELAAEMRDRYGEVRREVPATQGKGRQPAFVEDLPEPVENLFAIARMRLLGRRIGLAKITATQLGFRLVREQAVAKLGPAVQPLIRNGNPKVYTDDPNALEFAYADWRSRRGPAECAAILAAIAKA
jgi:transcription-repair coupling factor (superfamily II helicase)